MPSPACEHKDAFPEGGWGFEGERHTHRGTGRNSTYLLCCALRDVGKCETGEGVIRCLISQEGVTLPMSGSFRIQTAGGDYSAFRITRPLDRETCIVGLRTDSDLRDLYI